MYPTATQVKGSRQRYHSHEEATWMPAIQLSPNLRITYINYKGTKRQALEYAAHTVQQLKGVQR